AFALDPRIDHLALIPRTIHTTFWLEVAVTAFALFFLITTRAAGINRPGSKAFVGIGAFNLVSAKAFHRTPGFEWLRLEPGDDVALGFMLKQAAGTTRLAFAQEELSVQWYPSVAAMFKGLAKSVLGAASCCRCGRMTFKVVVIWAVVFAPPVAFLLGPSVGSAPLWIAGAAAISMQLLFSVFVSTKLRTKSLALLLLPVGMLLIT